MQTHKKDFDYLGLVYQERLLAQVISDTNFARKILPILKPEYFSSEELKIITNELTNSFSENEVVLDYGSILIRLKEKYSAESKQDIFEAYLNKIKGSSKNDWENIQRKAISFCKSQEFLRVINEVNERVKKSGDCEDALDYEKLISDVLNIGKISSLSKSTFGDIESLLRDDYRKTLPTGIVKLDEVMGGGLARKELGILIAPLGTGKAQPLFSKILTPNGWTTMGEIKVGDMVITQSGKPTRVSGVFPQGLRPTYKVSFNDGTSTICDEEHLWSVNSLNQRNRRSRKNGKNVRLEPDYSFKVMKTKDMVERVKIWGCTQNNFRVPIIKPVQFEHKELPLDGYVLGILLGDGSLIAGTPCFDTKDDGIIDEVRRAHPEISVSEYSRVVKSGDVRVIKRVRLLKSKEIIKNLGLNGKCSETKFIPKEYLFSDVNTRVRLLQGLIDSDGFIDKNSVEYTSVSKDLAEGVREIVLSLGGKVSINTKKGKLNGIEHKLVYRVVFSLPDTAPTPTLLERKAVKYNPRTKYRDNKYISSIEPYGEHECQCIMVEDESHLYVTDDYIVTHNTTLATIFCNTAYTLGYNVLQICFEDHEVDIKRKHLSRWTGYEAKNLAKNSAEVKQIAIEKTANNQGNLFIVKLSSIDTTMSTIKRYVKDLKNQGYPIDMMVIDYIDCVQPSRHSTDPHKDEAIIMREYENLLSEFDIAGWAMTQGNRCVRVDQRVEVEGRGYIAIGDVVEGDKVLTHKGFKTVTNVFPRETQKTYKIRTKSGKEIIVSGKHKFPTKNKGNISINEGLRVGDNLLIK